MKEVKDKYVQGSFFEDDYLIRTLGSIRSSPEIALTELVANAWDTGASEVNIFIRENKGELLSISDNGVGLTKKEFYDWWMKLGYNRLKHQSEKVEFPAGVKAQRIAYGRNGVGRHGERLQPISTVKNANGVEMGKVKICLFSQFVDSAEKRLFGLKAKLNERYANVPGMELYSQQVKQLNL